MARKKTISGESIINAGLQMIVKEGIDSFNARHLAEEMGITTTPIFTNFGSMDNLLLTIWSKAKKEFDDYLLKSLDYPVVFKEFGLRFLNLATESPNLFKFVFLMQGLSEEQKSAQRLEFNEVFKPILDSIRNPFRLSEEGVSELIHVLVTFTTGLAVSYVNEKNPPDKIAYSIMLSYLFDASCEYIAKKGDLVSHESFVKEIERSNSL